MSSQLVRALRLRRQRTTSSILANQVETTIRQMSFFYDELGGRRLDDATVVEIGPGDAIPLAFLFLALGAKRYVAVDRYRGRVFSNTAMDLYRAVAAQLPPTWDRRVRAEFARIVGGGRFPRELLDSSRVVFDNSPIETLANVGYADLIVSFNVLEHCSDVVLALRNMASVLSENGLMIHRIDYSAHDIWRSYDNPLEFLTFSERLWILMGSNRGYPNRARHSRVLEAIRASGLQGDCRVSADIDMRWVREIRKRLPQYMRAVSDMDLSISDAVLVLSKDSKSDCYSERHMKVGGT